MNKKMHAKLLNGCLRSSPSTVILDGRTINNPLPEELVQLGYKPVVYTGCARRSDGGQALGVRVGRGRDRDQTVMEACR